MKNIIAFSGTHGTGKSTCAYNLAAKLKMQGLSVVVLDEVARECPLPINQGAGELTQYWILSTQIRKEIKLMSKYDYVVCDRSIIDTIAYGVALGVSRVQLAEAYYDYIIKYYKSIYVLNHQVFNYQLNDGVRDLGKEFRDRVSKTLIDLYLYLGIPFTKVNSQEELDAIKV